MPVHRTPARGRLRTLSLLVGLPAIIAGGVVLVAHDAQTWTDVVILSLGVLTVVLTYERWTAQDLARFGPPGLLVAALVWPLSLWLTGSPNGWYGLTLVGALSVPRLPRHRYLAAAGLMAYVGLCGAAHLLLSHPTDVSPDLLRYVLLPTGITAVVLSLMFPNKAFYDVIRDLEVSRDREAELAVTRERARFAGDLHDIQGHTLHVVRLKVALAGKLVRSDPERAEQELKEVHALVADTIRQGRDLAYAQRRLNLTAELENAKNLFEAAGIRVTISEKDEVDAGTGVLLGQVLRETATNILRHAQATHVDVTLTASGITIVNDGAPEQALPPLGGLAALRQRLGEAGGELSVKQNEGRFVTAASVGHLSAGIGQRGNG